MIEPTVEMRAAFLEAREDTCDEIGCGRPECLDVRLAAVLAVIEKNYDVRCGAPCPPEVDGGRPRCDGKAGHDREHTHIFGGDVYVEWA